MIGKSIADYRATARLSTSVRVAVPREFYPLPIR